MLAAVAGATADRGWSYLLPTTREEAFGGDVEAYVRRASAEDWSSFRWSISEVEREEPFSYNVVIQTDGELLDLIAQLTEFEDVGTPTFLVRFHSFFGGDGIWSRDTAP